MYMYNVALSLKIQRRNEKKKERLATCREAYALLILLYHISYIRRQHGYSIFIFFILPFFIFSFVSFFFFVFSFFFLPPLFSFERLASSLNVHTRNVNALTPSSVQKFRACQRYQLRYFSFRSFFHFFFHSIQSRSRLYRSTFRAIGPSEELYKNIAPKSNAICVFRSIVRRRHNIFLLYRK